MQPRSLLGMHSFFSKACVVCHTFSKKQNSPHSCLCSVYVGLLISKYAWAINLENNVVVVICSVFYSSASFCTFIMKNCKDSNHMNTVGGKMSLPHELSKIIHPETKTKDNGFDLLQAFQGLNFNTAALTGKKHSKPTPKLVRGQSCKVMWSLYDHRAD